MCRNFQNVQNDITSRLKHFKSYNFFAKMQKKPFLKNFFRLVFFLQDLKTFYIEEIYINA